MTEYLRLIAEGGALTQTQAEQVMHVMLRGEAGPEETAGLLMGLRARGETLQELVGFTRIMRQYATAIELNDPHAIDLCGTGGDNTGAFNISTAASFVCAGAGVTVAKHGNRSVSSKCGSADVLEALGVNVELRKAGVEYCLKEAGIAFIFAPFFHPALRHVMPVRKKLAARTFFNILGPLCNPAGVRRQLVGAFSIDVAQLMASILSRLDALHVVAVHSEDGMDEISLSAGTQAFEYSALPGERARSIKPVNISPEQHGFSCVEIEVLRGGTAGDNAALLKNVLLGKHGPHRDIVMLNAAYALHASGRFSSLSDCFGAARESIDSGAALRCLDNLISASRHAPQST